MDPPIVDTRHTFADSIEIEGKDEIYKIMKEDTTSVFTPTVLLTLFLPALFGFFVGFFWNIAAKRAHENNTSNVEDINRQFNEMRIRSCQVKSSLQSLLFMRYRIKATQYIYYASVVLFFVSLYASKSLFHFFIEKHYVYTIIILPTITALLIGVEMFINSKIAPKKEKVEQINEDISASKEVLIKALDPNLLKTLKDIVRGEMNEKRRLLEYSDEGCSTKCMLINKLHKLDLERNKKALEKLIEFPFCDICVNPDTALECKSNCGKKFFEYSKTHLKHFDDASEEINKLSNDIKKVDVAKSKDEQAAEYIQEKKSKHAEELQKVGRNSEK